ncbi:unnamed protein product [Lupinus luteus]|uniref:non-specific serine/threonine protein kinase n=1 Tax=Lupinus luteus TaxID=3873 RepID=A0AAV1VZH8_LUPLU
MANSNPNRNCCIWNNKKIPSSISKKAQDLEEREKCTPLSSWTKILKLYKSVIVKHLSCFTPCGLTNITGLENKSVIENSPVCSACNSTSSLFHFSNSCLKHATNNFGNENLIGKGGFAEVYKGRLQNGEVVAVKRMIRGTKNERTSNFLSELGIIAHIDHPNIAKLIGCGGEGEMLLVFQLSPMGSLGSLLHGPNKNILDWSKRYKIALGIAEGLVYLHEECDRRIIHRDIKCENILLTNDFEPQICDFGLAKWLPEQSPHLSPHDISKFEGTFGYFAPEYILQGIVNEKTDVYSYGVLLLEIITGRRALDHLQQSIVVWARPLIDANNIRDLVDPSLGDDYDQEEMKCVVLTASLCVEQSPFLRPRMSEVAILLRGVMKF